MKLSVIIPMYNEKEAAPGCVKELSSSIEADACRNSYDYEIIFSDDGSADGCGDIVREIAGELNPTLTHGSVRVITSPCNEGKGGAVRRGMLESSGDYALFTDCDLAYGCEVICGMLERISSTHTDILIGSRAAHPDGYAGYTFVRKIASKAFLKLLALSAGFDHSDSQCGIKMFSRRAADGIFSRGKVNGWAFDFESLMIAEKLGFTIDEYPVKVINHRESKIHLVGDSLKMLSDLRKIKKRIKREFR